MATKRVEIATLVRTGHTTDSIIKELNVSKSTVCRVRKRLAYGEDLKDKPRCGRPVKIRPEQVKAAFEATPTMKMSELAKKKSVDPTTVSKAVKAAGGRSLRKVERPLLTQLHRNLRLDRCRNILSDLKHNGDRVVFSNEKTFTVDPVYNKQNDRVICFGDVSNAIRSVIKEETIVHQPSEIQTELPNESPVFDSNIEIKEEIYGEEPMDSLNIDNACPVSQFMTPEMLSSLASSEPNCVSPHVIFEDHSYALGKPNETAMEVYLRQKVRRLQSQLRHRDKKIIEQNLIIGEIRIKTSIPVCVESILEKNFSGLILEIMKNELKSRKCSKFRREYSDEIKQFAETCYSISAKAYEYLRPIMNLPHPRNLKSWKSIFDENPPQLVKTEENDDGEGFLLGL